MKKSNKIANEIWRMLPDECKEIMKEVKDSFIDSVASDIEGEYETISLSDINGEIRMPSPLDVVPCSLFLKRKNYYLNKTMNDLPMKSVRSEMTDAEWRGWFEEVYDKANQNNVQFFVR